METKAAETDLGKLRDAVAEALDEQGHNTAASLLAAGRWKLDEEGAIQVEVGVKKTMLGLTMNGEAWKIVREALAHRGRNAEDDRGARRVVGAGKCGATDTVAR